MDTKCDIFYPSAPFENFDLEQRLEKKLNNVRVFLTTSTTLKKWLLTLKTKITNQNRNMKKI